MRLARFPRRRYTPWPTPIEKLERLDRLTAHLGGPAVYIKRDDVQGLGGGGNKLRKLEFLVADALARGADTLITGGALQSNHCRLTLAAANREGLRCRLVLQERTPRSYRSDASGNNLLYRLLGAEEIRVIGPEDDIDAAMQSVCEDVEAAGRRGYVIPVGGSTPLGALGYVACAQEILAQGSDRGIAFDHVVCASGSAGTQAGLVAGMISGGSDALVTGICVSRTSELQEPRVRDLAEGVAEILGMEAAIPLAAVRALDAYVGSGYAHPTEEMREAVSLLARLEGILLDPVYTGKAMAGLVDLIRTGQVGPEETVLFVHTGGTPGLYAYPEQVL